MQLDPTNVQGTVVQGTVAQRRVMAAVPWLMLAMCFGVFYLLYFSPVLVSHHYLAPGDGELYYLPFFDLPIAQTWNGLILSGAPIIADIQSQVLYPVRWLSPSFNLLVVSAYVVAAFGMFGLATRLTGSRIGGLAAALIVSGSGFLVGHLGHLTIVHAAAWIPHMLWAVASMRKWRGGWPVVLGSAATALSVYGGHPQISVIGLLLAGCYGLYETLSMWIRAGRRQGLAVFWRVFAMLALGIALSAPVLMPFMEAASDGVRAGWSMQDFGSYSHTLSSLRLFWFPNLYGANPAGPYGAYSGPWNSLTELAIYAGAWTWTLAIAAVLGWKRDRSNWFWVGAFLLAVLLALGTATPLSEVTYRLPVLGKFRAQARFGIVAIIALGVLSAFGISALLRERWSRSRILWLAGIALGLFILVVSSLAVYPPAEISGDLWSRPSGWVPLALMASSVLLVVILAVKRTSFVALSCLLFLAIDLGSFGWTYEWKYPSATRTDEALPEPTARLVDELARTDGRLLPLHASAMSVEPVRPNVNIRYGIKSVVGYGPLVSARYATYAGADTIGGFSSSDPSAPIMDVLAVRWISGSMPSSATQLLGHGCGANQSVDTLTAHVPKNAKPVAIELVSHLGCSAEIDTGSPAAEIRLRDQNGATIEKHSVDVGEETAEWAYDRADVRPVIAHARPQVAETFDGGGFKGLWFQARWPIAEQAGQSISTIEVTHVTDSPVPIRIRAIRLIDSAGQVMVLPLGQEGATGERALGSERNAPGLPPVRERLSYGGMAWAVCTARSAPTIQIVNDLAGQKRADGSHFDAHREALIEEGFAVPALACAEPPKIHIAGRRAGGWNLESQGQGPALLIISESYNDAWVARVDDVETAIVPVDGLVLGVPIPAGTHRIEVQYRPRSFRNGMWVALLALVVCVVLLWPWRVASAGRNSKVVTKDGT